MMYVADFMKQLIFSIFWLAFLIVSMWTHVRSQHMYGGTIVVIAVTEDGVIVGAVIRRVSRMKTPPDAFCAGPP